MPAGRVAGALLAGGASRRFPGDKRQWRLPGRTRPLALETATRLAAAVGAPCAWIAPEAPPELPAGWSWQADSGAGPLAALASALDFAVAQAVPAALVVAADLPALRVVDMQALVQAWREQGSHVQAVCARDASGRLQPLCAVYPSAWRDAAAAAADGADRAVHRFWPREPLGLELRDYPVTELAPGVAKGAAGTATIHPCFNLNRAEDAEYLRALFPSGSSRDP